MAIIYRDHKSADFKTNPQAYVIETKTSTRKTVLKITTVAAGGFGISIVPKN